MILGRKKNLKKILQNFHLGMAISLSREILKSCSEAETSLELAGKKM